MLSKSQKRRQRAAKLKAHSLAGILSKVRAEDQRKARQEEDQRSMTTTPLEFRIQCDRYGELMAEYQKMWLRIQQIDRVLRYWLNNNRFESPRYTFYDF